MRTECSGKAFGCPPPRPQQEAATETKRMAALLNTEAPKLHFQSIVAQVCIRTESKMPGSFQSPVSSVCCMQCPVVRAVFPWKRVWCWGQKIENILWTSATHNVLPLQPAGEMHQGVWKLVKVLLQICGPIW